jgi:hypothetical protein
MSPHFIKILENWGFNAVPYARLSVLVRPTSVAHPNTYVYIFQDALRMDGVMRSVNVDVHYEGQFAAPERSIRALGGLWVTGIGGAIKPMQHGGRLRSALLAELPRISPRIGIDTVYGDLTGTAPLPGEELLRR